MLERDTKTAPLGICDLCGGPIANPYTSKGKPRLYCSRDCRNTANSRAGSLERGRKVRERIASGEWVNPATINPPDPAKIGTGVRRVRLREVAEGRWRNPGLTPEARAKNSEPHIHSGALADAIEKLRRGKMADLTPEEAEAYRAHARERRRQLWQSKTEEEREEMRRKWREYAKSAYWRKKGKPPP